MSLRVLWHRVLVKPEEVKEKSEGGIEIPETSRERIELAVTKAEVVGFGPDAFNETTLEVSIGDTVIFAKYAGLPVESEDVKYRIMNDIDVLAVEEKKE